ncbi:SDR family NAD(P)-dependent oxidoreductase [Aurantivibrio plasticivorans]
MKTKGVTIFSLEGKNALITGATGHLGTAMATILAEAGANVLINSRSQDRSKILVENLQANGLKAESAAFDVTSDSEVQQFSVGMKERPLHVLVNNAYVGGAGSIKQSQVKDYSASYDVSVLSVHRLFLSLLPNLRMAVREAGFASVINMASMYALVSPDQRLYSTESGVNPPYYGAAKAALLHWVRYAGCEFGKEGIRVNAISPGPFPSEVVQNAEPSFVARLCEKVPMGRIGQAEEIKGPALFLASNASSYVNGANIVVDGGWTCW